MAKLPTPTPTTAPKVFHIPFRKVADVPRREINWLWYPYIPRGATTLVIGDGGYGKSWLTCALAADLSAGRALPGQEALEPHRILMLSAEDGIGEVTRPKLEALGADLDKVYAYDEGFILNPGKVAGIVEAIKEFDVAVVFLDPLVVYMGGGVDINRANETRGVVQQLTDAAKELHVAVVIVHHVRKMDASKLQHKTLGSVDLVNSVRSTLLVDISKTGQRYMAHVKHNWSEEGPTMAYNFDGKSFAWSGTYAGAIDDNHEVSLTRRGQAKSFLIATLRDGPVAAIRVMELAVSEGLNETTLQRAKKGVAKSVQTATGWVWVLEADLLEKIKKEQRELATDNTPDYALRRDDRALDGPAEPSGPTPEELLRQLGRGPQAQAAPNRVDSPPPAPAPTPDPLSGLDPGVLALARARLSQGKAH